MSVKRDGSSSLRIEGLYGVLDPSVVTLDAKDPEEALEIAVSEALAGGCRIIQYRDKHASPRKAFSRARRLAGICGKAGALFVVNDRLDVALMAGAGGCHLGQDDLPIPEARRLTPPGFLLGTSTHNVVEARQAEQDGADYIGVGAIFRTTTKDDALEPGGPKLVAEVARSVSLPAIAISGITRENVREVIRAGASGFAVISDLFGGPEIRERAREFLRIWEEEKNLR
jgi:thiamine-phosphate pyrophosphorylase